MRIEGALGENAPGLTQSETTVAECLREAGYATALVGKWHLGYRPTNGPTRHGFETFVGPARRDRLPARSGKGATRDFETGPSADCLLMYSESVAIT